MKTLDLFADMVNDLPQENFVKKFTSIELFAGAGGLALGFEKAGFEVVLLNECDKYACQTLRQNRPNWHVLEQDVADVDFRSYRNKVDFLSGGFPCQAFSYAGKGEGFNDTRGTMFFQFARAIDEVRPKVILGENVKGLLTHDNGRTLAIIQQTLTDLGYVLIEPKVLNAVNYRVPQKRERVFIVGIRQDLADKAKFYWPQAHHRPMTMTDALKCGELYDSDVPKSDGQAYPEHKKAVLDLVPQGGCWRDLPDEIARQYMKKSYFLGGGKTGMARRLGWHEPSLTLTCSPAQNQTERCHPDETRPLTVREYARIQTFPDDWQFAGSINQKYKQIGNAVPVNLAYAIGLQIHKTLLDLSKDFLC
ncbi:DNA-methyltransferase Dcm [Moraxella macacae 0408225]|uniref:Cytosine-specific methyltransferase n=1 Tax=Moraxella macacae 0408225 TaxID=1230338 RepID=L2F5X2_9GAMM|nr:DNA cytosine methyltransferase [Moraxella macacae]ELA08166.1 DNA-methyltransferase Dcm [Moraxella macacae 0408225]